MRQCTHHNPSDVRSLGRRIVSTSLAAIASIVMTLSAAGQTRTLSVEPVSAEEGEALTFTVSLDGVVAADVRLRGRTEDGTATAADDDYTPTPPLSSTPLTIPAGETSAAFVVATTEDDKFEVNETFRVIFFEDTGDEGGGLPSGVVFEGGMASISATGTITNDDLIEVSIGDAEAMEGEALTFTVSLPVSVTDDVELTFATANGTATADDYTVVGGSVTIMAGDTSATFTVATTEDDMVEPDETLGVSLTAPGGLPATVRLASNPLTATGTITNDDFIEVSIEDAEAMEGEALTFTVSLPAPVTDDVELTFATANGTATADDYTVVGGSVTIMAGDTSATFTVATTEDDMVEPDETLGVSLTAPGGLPATVRLASNPLTATGTITDDDFIEVSMEDAEAMEGEALTFTVSLSAPVTENVMLAFATADGTAMVADGDYTAETAGSVTIPANGTSATFTVATTEDDRVELNETLTVSLTASSEGLPDAVMLASDPLTATGTIINDDTATEETALLGPVTVVEGYVAEFVVNLPAVASQDTTLIWTATDATAQWALGDYGPNGGTLIIEAGETRGTIRVQTGPDELVESHEAYLVTVKSSANEVLGSALGGIIDDDTAQVNITDAAAPEGEEVTFMVTLTAEVSDEVVLPWHTLAGTASADDYVAITEGALTIPAGETAGTLAVRTTDDSIIEADETFQVRLASAILPRGVELTPRVAGRMATGTIINDDGITLAIADASAAEGEAVNFPVTLTVPLSRDLLLTWRTADGTATAASDYTAVADGALTIPAGETTAMVTVGTREDATLEPDETFTVTLTAAEGALPAEVLLTRATATGTITDDDGVALTIADASAAEGEAVNFPVTLSAPLSGDLLLAWRTADGTATAASDYTAVADGALTIPAGETTAMVTVGTGEDVTLEPDETFTVTLTAAAGALPAGVLLARATATGTIVNDDVDDDGVALRIADASAAEGEAVNFPVTLSAPLSRDLLLTWRTADGTATAASDYTAVADGALTIPVGETAAMVTVGTREDATLEPDETFTVTLTAAEGPLPAGVVFARTTATGTITNDDRARLGIDDASATEGEAVSFPVTLSAPLSRDLMLTWRTADGTATAATGDYAAVLDGMLTIPAGETIGAVTVRTAEDAEVEADETFTVTVAADSALPAGVVFARATATATIVNDDVDDGAVSVSIADASVDEGQVASFTVTLTAPVSVNIMLTWRTIDGTAMADDYVAMPGGVLNIAAGETMAVIAVPTTDDDLVESNEVFSVVLLASNLPSRVRLDARSRAQGVIEDDDLMAARYIALEQTLTGVGRALATDAVETISDRFIRSRSASPGFTLAGRALRLDGSGISAWRLAAIEVARALGLRLPVAGGRDETGRLSATGLQRWPSSFGSAAGLWVAPAGAGGERWRDYGFDQAGYGAAIPWTGLPERAGGDGARASIDFQRVSTARLLAGSAFDMPLGANQDAGASPWTLWGRGSAQGYSGKLESSFKLDGDVYAGYLGLDYRPNPELLLGVTLSHGTGTVDYHQQGSDNYSGELDTALTSVLPYGHWTLRPGLDAWGLLGVGRGSLELTDLAGRVEADLDMLLVATGGRGALASWRGWDLALKADAFRVTMLSEENARLPQIRGASERLRVSLEGRYEWALSATSRLSPRLEIGGRWDGGDAESGGGVELGGGLAWRHTTLGVELDASGRYLLVHEAADFEEWGASLTLRVDPGVAKQGPWLSVAPTWGDVASDMDQLWGTDRILEAFTAPATPIRRSWSPDVLRMEWGYGLALDDARLLTSYGGMSQSGRGNRRYRLGGSVELGDSLNLSLEGERVERDGDPAYGLLLRGRAFW